MITKSCILILLFLLVTTICYSQDSVNERKTTAPLLDSEGNIYVGCSDGLLYSLKSDGTSRWTFKSDGELSSDLFMLSDGTIYVYSGNDTLLSLNPDGSLKKSYQNSILLSPAIGDDGSIYAGEEYQVKPIIKTGRNSGELLQEDR
jgi:outer membrane protein assembly factor BamB